MLASLLRWFRRRSAVAAQADEGTSALRDWADQRGWEVRAVKDGTGAVVEGRMGTLPWRLEWGPPQRPYVQGAELRVRAELGFGADLQLLVLNRSLQEAMERQLFDQYVESVKTQIDDQTPPEMRWLVMFPKLSAADLGLLREGFAATANQRAWLLQWMQGPLAAALNQAVKVQALPAEHPLVLMIGRGRLVLRTQSARPDAAELDAWIKLFETALREARRVGAPAAPDSETGDGSATGSEPGRR